MAFLFFLCKDSPARALQVPVWRTQNKMETRLRFCYAESHGYSATPSTLSLISTQNFNTLSAFSSSRQVVAKENVAFQNFP